MQTDWKQQPHVMDRPITEDEKAHLEEYGYVIFNNALEDTVCDQLVEELFDLAKRIFGIEKQNPYTWSAIPIHGCINIWHSETFNNTVRQHPMLYSIFAQLFQTHKLTVSVDRFGFKSPCNPKDRKEKKEMNRNLKLHHDLNIWSSKMDCPYYQAGIAIADCPKGGGGFFCIPKSHNSKIISQYKSYKQSQHQSPPPSSKKFITFDDQWEGLNDLEMIEVPLKKGDMIVWNGYLPHNGGFNTLTDHWRLHCFVRFVPLDGPLVGTDAEKQFNLRYQKIVKESIETASTPLYYSTGNAVKGASKSTSYPNTATLQYSWLGKRILGIEKWSKLQESHPTSSTDSNALQ